MKIKKILEEITKLHEENEELKRENLHLNEVIEDDELKISKLEFNNTVLKEKNKQYALEAGYSVEEIQIGELKESIKPIDEEKYENMLSQYLHNATEIKNGTVESLQKAITEYNKENIDESNYIGKLFENLNNFIYGSIEQQAKIDEAQKGLIKAEEEKREAFVAMLNYEGNYESGYAIPEKYKDLVEQYKAQVSLLTRDSSIFKEELDFTYYQKNELYEAVIMDYWHNVKKEHPDQSDSYFLDAFSIQDSCREYITPDGCSWSDGEEGIETIIMIAILNLCGCGTPDEVLNVVLKVLQAHDEVSGYSERIEFLKENNISQYCYEYIAHDITEKGLMEHGSSVYGSWLTDLGKCVLHDLKKLLNK